MAKKNLRPQSGPNPSEPHVVAREGLVALVICSTGTEDEAYAWARVNVMCGTTRGWQKIEEPAEDEKPIPCGVEEGRTHYLFVC